MQVTGTEFSADFPFLVGRKLFQISADALFVIAPVAGHAEKLEFLPRFFARKHYFRMLDQAFRDPGGPAPPVSDSYKIDKVLVDDRFHI